MAHVAARPNPTPININFHPSGRLAVQQHPLKTEKLEGGNEDREEGKAHLMQE